jgi:hypothetical protein
MGGCLKRATSRPEQVQQDCQLFDHLVGVEEQGRRLLRGLYAEPLRDRNELVAHLAGFRHVKFQNADLEQPGVVSRVRTMRDERVLR